MKRRQEEEKEMVKTPPGGTGRCPHGPGGCGVCVVGKA